MARNRAVMTFFIATQLAGLCRRATWRRCSPQGDADIIDVRFRSGVHIHIRRRRPTTDSAVQFCSARAFRFSGRVAGFYTTSTSSPRIAAVDLSIFSGAPPAGYRKCADPTSRYFELRDVAFSFAVRQKNGDRRAVTIRRPQHRGRRLQAEEDAEERDDEQD